MTQQATGIEAKVCADIAARQALGVAKYGFTVQDNPLTLQRWLQHAYEECLDQAVYLRRAMQALAEQPAQQEPVAWLHPANATCVTTDPTAYARGIPLYTSPPAQRKPLTETEIRTLRCDLAGTLDVQYVTFARAIEAAHNIKE